MCSVAAASPCHGENEDTEAINVMSWPPPPVDESFSRIGTSIRPAPWADDIKKDQPKRPRGPIRIPNPRGCACLRQSR